MTTQELSLFGALGAVLLFVVVFLIRMWALLRHLNTSFAKLGFVVREDAKKYFDDAASKIVDTNEGFQREYQKIVEDGTKTALTETGAIMERSLAQAHDEAGKIVLRARTDAQQIIQAARDDAANQSEKMLQRSGDAISWVLSQYIGKAYSTSEHEALIEEQIKRYVDEHRQ